jgi:DNA-3-methyladenine glycosylase II
MREAIAHLKKADPVMGRVIKAVGPYKLVRIEPTIETLCRSIVFQQLSGKAAATIFARFKKAVGRSFSAKNILKLSVEQMRSCGLSRQKVSYIRDLAERTVSKDIDFRRLSLMSDEEVIEHLTQIKGVGVWTVQMFLMFALGRPNVMPAGDLGIRNAIAKAYGMESPPKPAEILALSQSWHPYCSVATWYLWRSLSGGAQI